jgi:hypothetical protein
MGSQFYSEWRASRVIVALAAALPAGRHAMSGYWSIPRRNPKSTKIARANMNHLGAYSCV